ncbi:MAG TPA: MFS transporter [Anaerolineales bacterium]|nr:MFS transporter [Anaerolineales bacterium]
MRIHIPPALKHRRYFYLWLGLLISLAGSQMQITALFWHIRTLTGNPDPLALGGIGLARILPIVFFSVISGSVADTFDRRTIIFITQTLLALIALALAILTFTGKINLWYIYALTALQAATIAFDLPARQAMLPNLVPKKDLANAFSMQSIAANTGSVIGPMLAGVVIASLGQAYTYLFNAISFISVLVALALIGHVEQETHASTGVTVAAARDGLKFIFARPMILSTMLLDFVATFFASANTMMPIVARDILKVGEVGYGFLSAAQPVGSVLAALVISQVHNLRRQGPTFLWAVVAFGAATVVFGVTHLFVLAMLALILMGAADAVSTIIRNTIRQLQTPDHMRGRMTAVNQIFFQGGPQFGEVEAGVVAQLFGVPFAIISGGIGCILGVTFIAMKWPQIRTYNSEESHPAGAPAA